MPRHADHDQRRTQIADATLAVAASTGLASASVARVAARAGISVGLVQHYYPSKQVLVRDAYARASARLFERVDALVAEQEQQRATIRRMLVGALGELLPTDPTRRVEAVVRAEFLGRAATDPELARIADDLGRQARRRISIAIDNGRECGETEPSVDTDRAAWQLWSVTAGLSTSMLSAADVPALEVLIEEATRVLPHPCARGDDDV